MALGDKFHAADTSYEPDTAEYDAADYNYQIVDHSDDIVGLFQTAEMRDKVLAFLNAS
jgi:hypothetical protein